MAFLAYTRVSTQEQNLDRQKVLISSKFSIDKWFQEKQSGKTVENRPVFQSLIDYARPEDIIICESFSRISRSTKDLLDLLEYFDSQGIQLHSIKEDFDSNSANGKFFLTVSAALSELERTLIKERQAEGILVAKTNGVYKGRKPIEIPHLDIIYQKYSDKEATIKILAEELGISPATLYNKITEYKKKLKT